MPHNELQVQQPEISSVDITQHSLDTLELEVPVAQTSSWGFGNMFSSIKGYFQREHVAKLYHAQASAILNPSDEDEAALLNELLSQNTALADKHAELKEQLSQVIETDECLNLLTQANAFQAQIYPFHFKMRELVIEAN